jgi:hypothetical protein
MSLPSHFRERLLWWLLVALCASGASGCPRELEIPDASGPACSAHAECNAGATCGTLRACVLGHCETDPSLLVPCDAGALIDASIPDAMPDGF